MAQLSDLQEYERLCYSCTLPNQQEQEIALGMLTGFLSNTNNLNVMQQFLETCQNEMTVFMTSEILGKLFAATPSQGAVSIVADESKRNEIIGDQDIQIRVTLLQYLTNFTVNNIDKLKTPYIWKSISNTMSKLIKTIWTEVPTPDAVLQQIIELFFIEEESPLAMKLLRIGLRVMEDTIHSISQIANYNNVFWFFRRTTYMFQKTGLPLVFHAVFNKLKKFLTVFLEENIPEDALNLLSVTPDILDSLFQTFQSCMTYNYSLSYIDSELDSALDLSIICYPEALGKLLQDMDLFRLLAKAYFFYLERGEENPLRIIRGLNRWISGRVASLFPDKEQRYVFMGIAMNFSTELMKTCNIAEEQFVREALEFVLRMLNNFDLRKLKKEEGNFIPWIETLTQFSANLIGSARSLVSSYIADVHEIWRKIYKQKNFRISKFQGAPLNAVQRGLSTISSVTYTAVLSEAITPFDKDFDARMLVKYKKFTKVFRKTFLNLSEIFTFNIEENSVLLEKGCDELLAVLQGQSNSGPPLDVRICLLIGVVCHTVMANPTYESTLRELFAMGGVAESHSAMSVSSVLNHILGTVGGPEVSSQPNGMTPPHGSAGIPQQNLEPLRDCVGRIVAKSFEIIRIANETSLAQNIEGQGGLIIELSVIYFLDNFIDATIQGVELVGDGESMHVGNVSRLFQYTSKAMNLDGQYYKLIDFILKKIFANLAIRHRVLLEYSLFVFRKVLVKMKQHLPRDKFRRLPIITELQAHLQGFASTALAHKEFFKLRTTFYEILSIIFVDDYFDDYIASLEKLWSNITQTNNIGSSRLESAMLVTFFRDSAGVASYLDITKIFRNFMKLAYPTFSQLLVQGLCDFIDDQDVMAAAFDFLSALAYNKAQRFSFDPHNVTAYRMFKDIAILCLNWIGDLKGKLSQCGDNQEMVASVLGAKLKIAAKIWKLFKTLLEGKYLNFSLFHYFQDNTFIEFLRAILELNSSYVNFLLNFPKQLVILFDCELRMSEYLYEILLLYFDHSYLADLIGSAFTILRKTEENSSVEIRDVAEDQIMSKFHTIIYNLCCFCFEEMALRSSECNELYPKIEAFTGSYFGILRDIGIFLLEKCFSKDIKQRYFTLAVNTIFALFTLSDMLFEEIKMAHMQKFTSTLSGDGMREMDAAFRELFRDVDKKYDTLNSDKFFKNFKLFGQSYLRIIASCSANSIV